MDSCRWTSIAFQDEYRELFKKITEDVRKYNEKSMQAPNEKERVYNSKKDL